MEVVNADKANGKIAVSKNGFSNSYGNCRKNVNAKNKATRAITWCPNQPYFISKANPAAEQVIISVQLNDTHNTVEQVCKTKCNVASSQPDLGTGMDEIDNVENKVKYLDIFTTHQNGAPNVSESRTQNRHRLEKLHDTHQGKGNLKRPRYYNQQDSSLSTKALTRIDLIYLIQIAYNNQYSL